MQKNQRNKVIIVYGCESIDSFAATSKQATLLCSCAVETEGILIVHSLLLLLLLRSHRGGR